MRTPSIKAITPLTRGSGDAKLVKLALIEALCILTTEHERKFPQTMQWIRDCYSRPRDSEIRRRMVDEALGTYGVECGGRYRVRLSDGDEKAIRRGRDDHNSEWEESRVFYRQLKRKYGEKG